MTSLLYLQNGEHTGGCLVAGFAGAHRGAANEDTIAIDIGHLLGQADDDYNRSLGGPLRIPVVSARGEGSFQTRSLLGDRLLAPGGTLR